MKGKLTVREAIKQIGAREYYEAREKNLIAIYQPEGRHPYHEQWQIDDYVKRMKDAALRPAQLPQPPRRISNKLYNSPFLGKSEK